MDSDLLELVAGLSLCFPNQGFRVSCCAAAQPVCETQTPICAKIIGPPVASSSQQEHAQTLPTSPLTPRMFFIMWYVSWSWLLDVLCVYMMHVWGCKNESQWIIFYRIAAHRQWGRCTHISNWLCHKSRLVRCTTKCNESCALKTAGCHNDTLTAAPLLTHQHMQQQKYHIAARTNIKPMEVLILLSTVVILSPLVVLWWLCCFALPSIRATYQSR